MAGGGCDAPSTCTCTDDDDGARREDPKGVPLATRTGAGAGAAVDGAAGSTDEVAAPLPPPTTR